jgi:phage-related protein
LETKGDFDTLINNEIKLYNPGDKETDFIITLNFDSNGNIPTGGIFLNADN